MTEKEMTDEEFKKQVLTCFSKMDVDCSNIQSDFDYLKISVVLLAEMVGVDPDELHEKAMHIHKVRFLEKLKEKGE